MTTKKECPCNCSSCLDCENYAERAALAENRRVLDEVEKDLIPNLHGKLRGLIDLSKVKQKFASLRLEKDKSARRKKALMK